jgi:DNA-directed RNA polymerase subunit M/transcription elongation factor TFIIS
MKFCPDCSNFLYIKDSTDAESGESYLENYCRNCGFSEKRTEHKIDTFKIDNEVSYKNINPEEIINDLTYPRTRAVDCPSSDCATKTGTARREVLYFKQKGKLKLNYVCCVCKTMWKN